MTARLYFQLLIPASRMVVSIDPTRTFTKTEYLKQYPMDPKTLNKKIESREVRSIKVRGTVLVIAA